MAMTSAYASQCDLDSGCAACNTDASLLRFPNDPHRVPLLFAEYLLNVPRTIEIPPAKFLAEVPADWDLDERIDRPDGPAHWATTQSVSTPSASAKCGRALSFRAEGVEPSDQPSRSDLSNMRSGSVLHHEAQSIIVAESAVNGWGCATEVPIEYPIEFLTQFGLSESGAENCRERGLTLASRGFIDIAAARHDTYGYVELKFIADYSWRKATYQAFPRQLEWVDHEGPTLQYITQTALGVFAPVVYERDEHGQWAQVPAPRPMDWGRLLFGAKNLTSQNYLDAPNGGAAYMSDGDRAYAEWHWTRAELEPFLTQEMERMAVVADSFANGVLAPRRAPGCNGNAAEEQDGQQVAFGEIYDWDADGEGLFAVAKREDGKWFRSKSDGEAWPCKFCNHRSFCRTVTPDPGIGWDGPGTKKPEPITVAHGLAAMIGNWKAELAAADALLTSPEPDHGEFEALRHDPEPVAQVHSILPHLEDPQVDVDLAEAIEVALAIDGETDTDKHLAALAGQKVK